MAASSTYGGSICSISSILTRTAMRHTRSTFTLVIMRSCTLGLCAFQVFCILSNVSASCQSFSHVICLFVQQFLLDSLTTGGFTLEVWSASFALPCLPGRQAMANCTGYKTYEDTINAIQELRVSIPTHPCPLTIPLIDDRYYFFRPKSTFQVLQLVLVSDIGPLACKYLHTA